SPSSRVRSRSTRRTATVTTSAPDASMARTISALLRYFPVPTSKRDRKDRPPTVRGGSVKVCSCIVVAIGYRLILHQRSAPARPNRRSGVRYLQSAGGERSPDLAPPRPYAHPDPAGAEDRRAL